MATPVSTRRASVRHLTQSSRIPRPSSLSANEQLHDVANSASPGLHQGTKRRHASAPSNHKCKALKESQEDNISPKVLEIPMKDHFPVELPEIPKEDNISPELPDLIKESKSRRCNESSCKRKSKRRSSFVRGRISKVVPVLTSADLSFDFPEELTAEERLAKVSFEVLKFSLDKVAEEMPDTAGMQQFNVQGRDAGEACIQRLQATDMYKYATCPDRFLPNPKNEALKSTISELTVLTDRLKSEFDRWQEVLHKRTVEADEAKRRLHEIDDNPITEMPGTGFTAKQQKILAEKPKCNEILDRLQGYQENTVCSVDNLVSVMKTLQEFQLVATKKLDQHAYKIYKETFGDIEAFENPKELLLAAQNMNECG